MCHSDLGPARSAKSSTRPSDPQDFFTSMNILPRAYGEELQSKATSVNSKTTLSREEVSKDEEHQKPQDSSLKDEWKKLLPQPFILTALYTEIFWEKIDIFWSFEGQESKM
jgi:hypothetical protein